MRIVRNSGECFDGFANGRNLTSFIACDKLLSGEGGGFMVYSIDQIRSLASPIAASYGVRRMSLFGSYARGEETPDSDVDILFEPDRSKPFSLFTHGGMYMDLKELLGREVDLVVDGTLRPYAAESANNDKILIYERKN